MLTASNIDLRVVPYLLELHPQVLECPARCAILSCLWGDYLRAMTGERELYREIMYDHLHTCPRCIDRMQADKDLTQPELTVEQIESVV